MDEMDLMDDMDAGRDETCKGFLECIWSIRPISSIQSISPVLLLCAERTR